MDLFIKETLKNLYDENNLKFDETATTNSRIDKYVSIINNSVELLNVIFITRDYKILTKKLEDNIYETVDGWIYVLNIEDLRNEKQVRDVLYLSETLSELLKLVISAKNLCYLYKIKVDIHNKLLIDYSKFVDETIAPLIVKNNLHDIIANVEKINANISGNKMQMDYIKNKLIKYKTDNIQNISKINTIRMELKYMNHIFTNIYNMLKYEMRYI
uniref:Uncharacterized protein n=1 Tax=viral metagenome TaxID=1070528 RepID=A0A6C0BE70_9ZZZZ